MGKRLLIFGFGKKYRDLRSYVDPSDVIAFIDNKANGKNMVFEGKAVYSPYKIPRECCFDAILIMSIYYYPIKRQLMDIGIERKKIYSLFQIGELQPVKLSDTEMHTLAEWKKSHKRFLLVQHDGGGGGATIALSNLVLALREKYSVLVTVPTKGEVVSFYESHGIPYICNTQMNCDTELFRDIVCEADIVLVNGIINNNVIELLHKCKKTFYLWLHDHFTTYDNSDCQCLNECIDGNTKILAVSRKAMDVFTDYIKDMPYTLFPLSIRSYECRIQDREDAEIPTIAVIGDLCRIKGQDILLDALEKIKSECRVKLIGGAGTETPFVNKIIAVCQQRNYECMGKMTNREIHELYSEGKIHILICASRFETMSITSIEAMSYGVPIIVSDMTGVAEYIRSVEPNCIFKSEDSDLLAERIDWLLSDRKRLRAIGCKMRTVYIENFSMKELEKRCRIFNRQEQNEHRL